MSDKNVWSQYELAWMSSFLNNFSIKRAVGDLFFLHKTIYSQAPAFLRQLKP